VFYLGSVPWPSGVLFSLFKSKIFLFVHGFIYHEYLAALVSGRLRARFGALALLSLYETGRSLGSLNFICHSQTTCNMAKVPPYKRVILPQYFLEEDLYLYESIRRRCAHRSNRLRIVSYSSFADSPRLLRTVHIISLAKAVRGLARRDFEFVVVDPRSEPLDLGWLKVVKPLPREEFLCLVASSDLYIERCIDEELGYGSLEAMAMGVPVAKITHHAFTKFVDYGDAVLMADSFNKLARVVANYMDSADSLKPEHSEKARRYVLERRMWDSVKADLIRSLYL
ncbi:MAG: hypothetical protein QXP31_08820, partial [Pyrobaculum sp.]